MGEPFADVLGFGFRDWQRPDLSIDVIRQAAPDVQHLVLYWSGNQSILRGWASEEGIPRLCTPADKSELKTVTIQAAPVSLHCLFFEYLVNASPRQLI